MKRSSSSLQFLAASASMSSRPPYRGGRNKWRRGFSDRPHSDERDLFVTGDSHFQSVRDSNLGFRPVERGNFSNNRAFRPQPPPNFNQNQPNPPFQQFGPPFNQSQQFGPPRWTQNQPFRPQQQFRPRPPKPLDYRNWEFARPGPLPQCERFTVLSYNILADYLAINHRSKLYFHIPRHILDWEWRKRSIIFELGLWSADILCFQEADRFQELEEELKLRGYIGIWKMRTGDPVDGCAIFWRVSRFKLLHEECIEFNKLGLRDNVAQICVLESVKQNDNKSTPAFPTSSSGPNKVVICNIHVLYNPKRGEIKLGQVRVLLERANAASMLWDDAPVVLCGDFNCTPKSPLYNYVSEQKLNLSGLSRYEVSGQASAEIRAPRQFSPSFGHQSAQNSVRDRTTVDAREVKQSDSLLNVKKQNGVDSSVENDSSMTGSFQPQCVNTAVDVSDNSSFSGQYGNNNSALVHELTQETSQDEAESSICVPLSGLKESPSSLHKERGLSDDKVMVETHEVTELETHDGDICFNMIKTGHGEKVDVTFDAKYGSSSEPSLSNLSTENENINRDKGSPSTSSKDNVSCELTNTDLVVGEKTENLSLNELVEVTKEDENLGEDCTTFLSELHGTNSAPFPSDFSEFLRPDISGIGDEVLDDDSFGIDSVPVDVWKTIYDPSTWTPMEIETATGNADCKFMEHPLKLRSSYTEVEDCSGARDSNGEPLVTSYHRCFLGTVDYIWRSEGLQTVRVLAPIPKHAMQWTPGFPTKKWGSDHIALVSELAFTENTSTQNTEAL